MRVGNFSLLVPQGREADSGHVELAHGTVYTIRALNHCHSRRCDAEVAVDGKSLGSFRINACSSLTLERSAEDNGRFTFFKADSAEASDAGVANIAKDVRGLVQVTFRPELPRRGGTGARYGAHNSETLKRGGLCGQSCRGDYGELASRGLSAGVTGLTGHSNQSFTSVANLDYDASEEVTITLRLVAGSAVRELKSSPRANPVPAAID